MKRKISTLIFIFLFLLNSLAFAQTGKIIIEISGFKNTNGLARITLFNQSKGFPSQHQYGVKSKSVKLDTTVVSVEFDSLEYGDYAVSVLHDENKNGKIDTNFIGIPNEGYGVSRNKNPSLRAPRFDEALFLLKKPQEKIKIILQYR